MLGKIKLVKAHEYLSKLSTLSVGTYRKYVQ